MDGRFIGIDYGTKRVGIALSDGETRLAFPYTVLPNTKDLVRRVHEIMVDEKISCAVLGESIGNSGEVNPLMHDIQKFKMQLEKTMGIAVMFEPEFYTTAEAKRLPGRQRRTPATPRRGGAKARTAYDASAAAIILQSYLDKQHLAPSA